MSRLTREFSRSTLESSRLIVDDRYGNLLRFDKWNASTNQVEAPVYARVRYVINGANQITCIDDTSAGGAITPTPASTPTATATASPTASPTGTITATATPTNPPASGFGVNSMGDGADSNTADGVCNDGTGVCTLRAAIQQANATTGTKTITFNIPGAGPYVIQPASMLPAITDPVVIDGTTQPGYAGTPLIRLDGTSAGTGNIDGFVIRAGSTLKGLMIVQFASDGIALEAGSNGSIISGNFIGTDGTSVLRNAGTGIVVRSANNTIGGTEPADGNLVSGNGPPPYSGNGILLTGAGAGGNRVLGNRVGTNAGGTAALANVNVGVYIDGAAGNTIGGTEPGAGNLISGNGTGIMLNGSGAGGNQVLGNRIGTDTTGTLAVANSSAGVIVQNAPNNTIGGAETGAGNLISGNNGNGIYLKGTSTGNQVLGNRIGTDTTGTLDLGNSNMGIYVSTAPGNIIGGVEMGAGNLISGNNSNGIHLDGTSSTLVRGNRIGTHAAGTAALRNEGSGIGLNGASNNTIGGVAPGAGNLIAYNRYDGIDVHNSSSVTSIGNTIAGNRIDNNGDLGIDLYPSGVTANDAGDADSGPNNFQNYPLLASATSGSTSTMVSGTLNSLASTAFMLDFYASPTCDNSGNGQGAVYLGAGLVTTGADGNATFSLSVPTAATNGWAVTATATDPGGSTSEFSGCVTATQQAPMLARKAPASHGSNTLNKPFVSAPQELSAPIQIGPSGTGNTNPIYRWQPVATVTSYQLIVTNDASQTLIDRTYAADDVCFDSICQTQSAPLAEGTYSWTIKGNVTPPSAAMSFTAVAPVTTNSWHYEYDNLSRVTYACSQWDGAACTGNEFHYAYDGAGNLTRFDRWNASTASVETVRYVINGANQITCVDADGNDACNDPEVTWQYDAYGNLLTDGTNTYVYDAANRLSSITNAAGTTTYSYNGDGDRISQSVNGTLTTYVLDTATPLTMVLSESTGASTTRYWHGLDTLAQSDGTSVETFAYDGLGSVRQLVGESGSVSLAQTFDPYGNGYSKAGSTGSSFGYSGEQTDSNGFVYLRARYYNPAHGRFFQMDPSRQEKNLFQYAGSNPVMFIDPSGHTCLLPKPLSKTGIYFGPGDCNSKGTPSQRSSGNRRGPNNGGIEWEQLINQCGGAVQDALDWWEYQKGKMCTQSIDLNCGVTVEMEEIDTNGTSPSEIVGHVMNQYIANSWGGVDPEQLQRILEIMETAEQIAELNNLIGAPPGGRIESSYEFATSPRQEQLEEFANYYFGDLGFDVVYTDSFGEAHFGRHIDPGGQFEGKVYPNGALIVSESTIQKGWGEVGVTVFHEWLEQYRGELTHEEIYELEPLFREWFEQANH